MIQCFICKVQGSQTNPPRAPERDVGKAFRTSCTLDDFTEFTSNLQPGMPNVFKLISSRSEIISLKPRRY